MNLNEKDKPKHQLLFISTVQNHYIFIYLFILFYFYPTFYFQFLFQQMCFIFLRSMCVFNKVLYFNFQFYL